jgi:hypothetical protein
VLRNRAWLRNAMRAIDLCYFAGTETGCAITWKRWSAKPDSYARYYGEHEGEPAIIQIDRRLAWPAVPDYVVVGTVHHEMLHHRLGFEHDERFSLAEKRFTHHTECQVWDAYHWNDMVLAAQRPEWRLIR